MPDLTVNHGGAKDVSDTASLVHFKSAPDDMPSNRRRGSFQNVGEARVYFGWQLEDVDADETEGDGKGWVDPTGSLRIPRHITFACVKTASGVSKLLYIED